MKLVGIIAVVIVAGVVLGYFLIMASPTSQQQSTTPIESTTMDVSPTKNPDFTVEDIAVGTGREVKSGDTVVMHYTGTLTDGTKFDSSLDRGTPFETPIGVGRVIRGWDEGVPGMKIGGKRKLTIPPDMGYGAAGAGDDIPPNSTLIFEVELLDIK